MCGGGTGTFGGAGAGAGIGFAIGGPIGAAIGAGIGGMTGMSADSAYDQADMYDQMMDEQSKMHAAAIGAQLSESQANRAFIEQQLMQSRKDILQALKEGRIDLNTAAAEAQKYISENFQEADAILKETEAPYRYMADATKAGFDQYVDLSMDPNKFEGSTYQNYLMKQSEESLLRNAAASGGLQSGQTLKALQENAAVMTSGFYNDRLSQLGNLANIYSGTANSLSQIGANRANVATQKGTNQANIASAQGQNLANLGMSAAQSMGQYSAQAAGSYAAATPNLAALYVSQGNAMTDLMQGKSNAQTNMYSNLSNLAGQGLMAYGLYSGLGGGGTTPTGTGSTGGSTGGFGSLWRG